MNKSPICDVHKAIPHC